MNFLRDIIEKLSALESNPRIQRIGFRKLDRLPQLTSGDSLRLSLQFCPLYVVKGTPIHEKLDILRKSSYQREDLRLPGIFQKWEATLLILDRLVRLLREGV